MVETFAEYPPLGRFAVRDMRQFVVGLAGPPGAGKTTIASKIVKRVNKIWPQKSCSFDSQVEPPEIAIVLPMDGFHLYRHQLDSMEVIYRADFVFTYCFIKCCFLVMVDLKCRDRLWSMQQKYRGRRGF